MGRAEAPAEAITCLPPVLQLVDVDVLVLVDVLVDRVELPQPTKAKSTATARVASDRCGTFCHPSMNGATRELKFRSAG